MLLWREKKLGEPLDWSSFYDYRAFRNFLYRWPVKTAAINLDISQACNQLCIFCDKRIEFLKTRGRPKFWSVEDIKRIKNIIGFYPRVTFAGECGEPLLNPEIVEILREVKSVNKNIEVQVLSNGLTLTPELFEKVKHYVDVFRFSLNAATEETHNRIALNSDFRMVLDNLRYVRDHKPASMKTVISFIGMKMNIHELPSVVLMAEELGVYKVILQNLSETGYDAVRGQSLVRYPDLLRKYWCEAQNTIKAEGLRVYLETCSGYLDILCGKDRASFEEVDANGRFKEKKDFVPKKGETRNCPAPFFSTFVRFNGDIDPCPSRSLYNRKSDFGNIFTIGIPPIVSKKFGKLRKAILDGRLPDYCKYCNMMSTVKVDDFRNKIMSFVCIRAGDFFQDVKRGKNR